MLAGFYGRFYLLQRSHCNSSVRLELCVMLSRAQKINKRRCSRPTRYTKTLGISEDFDALSSRTAYSKITFIGLNFVFITQYFSCKITKCESCFPMQRVQFVANLSVGWPRWKTLVTCANYLTINQNLLPAPLVHFSMFWNVSNFMVA